VRFLWYTWILMTADCRGGYYPDGRKAAGPVVGRRPMTVPARTITRQALLERADDIRPYKYICRLF